MFKMLSKALYVLGFASLGVSIYFYSQGNHFLGTFLWSLGSFLVLSAYCEMPFR